MLKIPGMNPLSYGEHPLLCRLHIIIFFIPVKPSEGTENHQQKKKHQRKSRSNGSGLNGL